MLTVTTYRLDGTIVDEVEVEDASAAGRAAATILDDAREAGYDIRELTVRFADGEDYELVLGRDATVAAA